MESLIAIRSRARGPSVPFLWCLECLTDCSETRGTGVGMEPCGDKQWVHLQAWLGRLSISRQGTVGCGRGHRCGGGRDGIQTDATAGGNQRQSSHGLMAVTVAACLSICDGGVLCRQETCVEKKKHDRSEMMWMRERIQSQLSPRHLFPVRRQPWLAVAAQNPVCLPLFVPLTVSTPRTW